MKPIKLSELIEALEFKSDECAILVDLQEGDVVDRGAPDSRDR